MWTKMQSSLQMYTVLDYILHRNKVTAIAFNIFRMPSFPIHFHGGLSSIVLAQYTLVNRSMECPYTCQILLILYLEGKRPSIRWTLNDWHSPDQETMFPCLPDKTALKCKKINLTWNGHLYQWFVKPRLHGESCMNTVAVWQQTYNILK